MAKVETLTAYKCTFEYLQRNNPLKDTLKDIIKAGSSPEYTFENFITDFCTFTETLVVGKVTERAIILPKENIFEREGTDEIKKWRIVPYAGKQGKPFRIIKTSTGRRYDFGSDSAALYEHNIFMYQNKDSSIAIFHRQSGSGCKSIFMEIANAMLREKGMRMDMQLYLPLVDKKDDGIQPSKIQLQYIRENKSSDIAENMHRKRKVEVIQELGLNLESPENSAIKRVVQELKLGKTTKDVAFARIKQLCPNSESYNDAEIVLRIGKRHHKVPLGDFDSLFGNYDITYALHKKYKAHGDFIKALSELTDGYYDEIVAEEDTDG